MAKAIWEGTVLAESDQCVEVEGNQYFPPDGDQDGIFQAECDAHGLSRGRARRVITMSKSDGKLNHDAAWFYPEPKAAAKQIKGYVAFWKGVKVEK